MRPLTACTSIVLLALFTVTLATAESSVEVVFTNPEKFSDASLDSPGYERGADPYVMKQLRRSLARDITWPSIDLHYVLKQNGQIVSQADARVIDQYYLQRPGRANRSDRLYSEKAMLSDWFRRQFAEQHKIGLN